MPNVASNDRVSKIYEPYLIRFTLSAINPLSGNVVSFSLWSRIETHPAAGAYQESV